MEKFYSVKEIATMLNISKAQAYRLVYDKELVAITIGGTFRVRESDLKRFLNKNIY